MYDLLKNEAVVHGDRIQIVPVHHLADLKKDIEFFAENEELNGFQNWIVTELYNYTVPNSASTVRSILLMALSHPFYADVIFTKNGKEYRTKSLVYPDSAEVEKYLKTFLARFGYCAEPANNLPMKRLAVQSGLCEYGRNNITYIPGMGSNFSLVAYFSDMPCEKDSWRKVKVADECKNCEICLRSCPTGAIRDDRFLIDNQRCLSAMNESPGEFPEWLPLSVHHTCYDCLRCQENCPMNIGHTDKMDEAFVFSEQETEMLLRGEPIDTFPQEMKQKIYTLGLDSWYAAIPRNIQVLLR